MVFNYVSAVLMLIIGLGLTHLLGDVVYAFQDRRRTRPHWLPFIWAAIVFAKQMQFLWAIYELNDMTEWTAGEFVLMLTLALLLFVAGALVVPRDNEEGTDGWELFLVNGRWSLALLAAYDLVAYATNLALFEVAPFDASNLVNLALALLLVLLLFAKSKKNWMIGTIAFSVGTGIAILLLSPASYQ